MLINKIRYNGSADGPPKTRYKRGVLLRYAVITGVSSAILCGQGSAAASNTQYKIKQNLSKVELTVSYLALKESYRFHDNIVVAMHSGKLYSKTKEALITRI